MKVVILGAGASKCAGYPLASELMSAVETWSSISQNILVRQDWTTWNQFEEDADGIFRLLLTDPNPEVALSLLDLCEVSSSAGPNAFMSEIREEAVGLQLSQDDVLPERYFVSSSHQYAHRAGRARHSLLRCMEAFFFDKHADDFGLAGRQRRDYLRPLVSRLRTTDVVITLNWDTTIERTLSEENLWSPVDGYGFIQKLEVMNAGHLPFRKKSPITVLKLHGSIGWRRSERRGFYFDNADFLSLFEFKSSDDLPVRIVDPSEPEFGYPDAPLVAHPSFLKDLGAVEFRTVWERAAKALNEAKRVEVWGYSLPKSDHAARSLFQSLRNRLEFGEVEATVHDPNADTRSRWKELLGERVVTDSQALI